jgi:drug/metabolite transporter (DMT)-like permease
MQPERRAPAVIALAIVVVSFAAILIRLCTVPSAVIAAYRLCIASLILLPFYVRKARGQSVKAGEVSLCILAGLFLSIHFLSWIESLKLTSVASSVMLVTTSPVFAAIFAWLLLKEGIGRKTLVAIVLCILGSVAISRGGVDLSQRALRGNVLAILGAAAFGAYFVIGRKVRRTLGFLEFAFLAYTASAVMLIGWMAACKHNFTGFEPVNYVWILLLALGPQVFGHTSLNWALKYLPAPKIVISVLGEPIGSALLAWLFFQEVPGYSLLAGGALILYGVYLAMTEKPKPMLPPVS